MIRRTPAVAVSLTAAAMLAAGCGSSGGGSLKAQSNPPAAACPTTTPSVSQPQQFKAPTGTVAKAAYTMRIDIACKGTLVIAMNGAKTPATIKSFAFLASKHWFDNTPCHRLTTQGIFVLQCGDPTGTGTGGPGYTIPDENLKGAKYPAGTVAMANTGQPHSGGSQFFLVYAATQLPPSYTPFGHITQGLDVLRKIAAAGEDDSNAPGDGHPNKPVVIRSLTVTKG